MAIKTYRKKPSLGLSLHMQIWLLFECCDSLTLRTGACPGAWGLDCCSPYERAPIQLRVRCTEADPAVFPHLGRLQAYSLARAANALEYINKASAAR